MDSPLLKGKKRALIVDTEEEKTSKKKAKKHKKSLSNSDIKCKHPSASHDELIPSKLSDSELKQTNRGKTIGKKCITPMPIKRVLMIKPEKLKKGNMWYCDPWFMNMGLIGVWLVYGMTAGGAYRGRYRHPAYCLL